MPAAAMPTVSVVVVNYNGKDYLDACLGSLREQTYPAEHVEVILIDNASSDGSVEHVREAFPEVAVVVNDTNTGFSPAVNQGARLAGGGYLALLNNDAVAHPEWLAEALRVFGTRHEVACVACKIVRSGTEALEYAGGELSFYGHGFARKLAEQDRLERAVIPTLFPSGGAMVVRTGTFLDVGGFDESYFAFFEDVDFGWRLWVLGLEVAYVPASMVHHRHHGTIKRFGYARERYLLERNALATVFKNYGDEALASALPPTVVLTIARGLLGRGIEVELPDFSITEGAEPLDDQQVPISALAAAHLAAVRDFGLDLPTLRKKRSIVQARRVRSDDAILPMFRATLQPNVDGPAYLEVFRNLVEAFDLADKLATRRKVLIVTQDTIGERMAGPAIRAWEMAKVLSEWCDVTLASAQPITITHPDFKTFHFYGGLVPALHAEADVVVLQGFVMHLFPGIAAGHQPVVVDVYDPFHLEGLTLRRDLPELERYATANSDRRVLNDQLLRGDFFVCASDKQRDFWLGQLSGLARINPATFDQDDSLRKLIDVVPFGLPSDPPQRTTAEPVLRGAVGGIDADDFVLLWGGGIYNWFDPLTLIRAVGQVVGELPDVKLCFMGSAHPNPHVPTMQMASNAYRLAEDLGLLDKHVFFNQGWVPYEDRQNWLLEADVGVSTHYEHLETQFSYRTRILDYIWAGLPILATEGDSLAGLVVERGLGVAVPPEDVPALAGALHLLRTDRGFYERCVANLAETRAAMTWDKVLEPLAAFCRNPARAADTLEAPKRYIAMDLIHVPKPPGHYARRVLHYARSGGPKVVMTHARNFLRARRGG